MRLPLGEIPDVAKSKFGYLVSTIFINGGDKDATEEDLAPFCLQYHQHSTSQLNCDTYHAMPVQLANRTLFKMLLRSGNVVTCR